MVLNSVQRDDHGSFGLAVQPWGHQSVRPPSLDVASLWSDKALTWGFHNGVGEVTDRVLGLTGGHDKARNIQTMTDLGFGVAESKSLLTYQHLFRLKDKTVGWQELSCSGYQKTVQENFSRFVKALKPGNIHNFFEGVSLKSYLKEVVLEGNIKPWKDLWNRVPGTFIGSALASIAGMGLMGLGILQSTHQAYRNAKAREDGSWQSSMQTFLVAGQAFLAKTIKSLVCWEVAGMGFAFGKALLCVGAFPVGGILLGALLGVLACRGLEHWLPEPSKSAKELPALERTPQFSLPPAEPHRLFLQYSSLDSLA